MSNPRYVTPPEIKVDELRQRAKLRRAALTSFGCSTYTTGWRDGRTAILCLCCGLGSGHPNDVADRYCGFCHEYHSEWLAALDGQVLP